MSQKNTTLVSKVSNFATIIAASGLIVGCSGGAGSSEEGVSGTGSARANATIQGSALKGAIENGIVRAYPIELQNGVLGMASGAIDGQARTYSDGSFTLDVPDSYAGQTLILEVAADALTTMQCDVPEGCGTIGGSAIGFGDRFALSSDFVLRTAATVADTGNISQANISPLTHMAVARAMASAEGLSVSNIASARAYIEQTFDLESGVLDLAAADITRLESLSGLTQGQLEHGVVSASLLALVNSPDWDSIEEIIEHVTARLAAGGEIASVNMGALRDVTLDDVFFEANEIATDISAALPSSDYVASLNNIVTETQASYDEVVEVPEQIDPVQIVSHPSGVTVDEGAAVQFTVAASGGGSLSFQWRLDGENIAGATASTLTLNAVDLADGGIYDVVVSNSVGSVASLTALLQVNEVIVVDPEPVMVASIELSWDIPTEREDGTALELYEINGYVIRYGTTSGALNQSVTVNGGGETQALIEDLEANTYYFAIATVDSDGVQGDFSSEISETIM